jgi:hypothetical protein
MLATVAILSQGLDVSSIIPSSFGNVRGVGHVPSTFLFTGAALAGDLAVELAAALGGLTTVLAGVGPALAGLEPPVPADGVAPPALSFLGAFLTGVAAVPAVPVAAGVTFLVAAVPVVAVGFEALLTAVFPVEAVEVAVFFSGVAVDFAGVVVAAAGFVSPAAVRTGSFFCVPIGVLVFAAGVAVLVAFFTGGMGVVFDVADCVALAGVETVFFAADVLPAVLATLLTFAMRWR